MRYLANIDSRCTDAIFSKHRLGMHGCEQTSTPNARLRYLRPGCDVSPPSRFGNRHWVEWALTQNGDAIWESGGTSLNKREKPTPMQEGASREEDLPEIRCLKGRPTSTQAASMRSHAEVVIVDDVSEPATSSRWSDTTQYRWVYLYTASLPSLQTDYLLLL